MTQKKRGWALKKTHTHTLRLESRTGDGYDDAGARFVVILRRK